MTALVEPAVVAGYELGIASIEIPVSHAPASGEQIEGELERLLPRVLRDVLEPLEACLRRSLCTLDHWPSLGLIGHQRLIHARVFVKTCSERKRILHRQLRS